MSLTWKHLPELACYVAEDIAYCDHPQAPHLQRMHLYVPEELMGPDGTPRPDGQVVTRHGACYTASTVPVVFYNDIGGYAECEPARPNERNQRYIEDRYVVASVGARGRQSRDETGGACGKAPAGLVDLKSAVRWLRAHADELPAGDLDHIVSVGTSAGGAMSSLLGLSGDCATFEPLLLAAGAAQGVSDAVWAAQCYCPITDLDHADMAYEWMFGAKSVCTMKPQINPTVLDGFQRALGARLAQAYPAYVGSLGLGVTLGADGRSGSFYEGVMAELTRSLNVFLTRHADSAEGRASLAAELDGGAGFIAWDDETGLGTISDLDAYVLAFIGRKKECPAFDPLGGCCPENQEFGRTGAPAGSPDDKLHFSPTTASLVRALADERGTEAHAAAAAAYERDCAREGQSDAVALLNPLSYLGLGDGAARPGRYASTKARHVRIRLGACDADSSFSASYLLYQAVLAAGIDASYGLVWGLGHCDADYPGEFSAWVDDLMAGE